MIPEQAQNPQPDQIKGILKRAFTNTVTASERARLQRLEVGSPYLRADALIATKGTYSRTPAGLLNAGNFDIRSAKIINQGSITPTSSTSGAFAYTSDTSSIHWYWDGTNSSKRIIQRRADGSKFVIPAGDLNVTGLSANTTYYFYPFWPTYSLCQIGWVQINGTSVGTPAIAFSAKSDDALQLQALADREPLTAGAMTGATTAAGSGSGFGGGGGQACVMAGTAIEPVGESPYSVGIHPQNDWVRIEAGLYSLSCTPNHPLYAEHCGRIQARDVVVGMELLCSDGVRRVTGRDTFLRACSKRSVHLDAGHLYWANGFLSHNSKWAPP